MQKADGAEVAHARIIASSVRSRATCAAMLALWIEAERGCAAAQIQARVRSLVARRKVAERLHLQMTERARLCIQAAARGFFARRKSSKFLAVTIAFQAALKAKATRERYLLITGLRRAYSRFLMPSELVVLCAVVKRLDAGWGSKSRHQLCLTSSARILCLDQDLETFKFQLTCRRGECLFKNEAGQPPSREFTIVADDQTRMRFIDVLGEPSRWASALRAAQGLAGLSQADAVAQLVLSAIYQPSCMLRCQGYLVKRSLNKKEGASAHWQRRWLVLHGRTLYWYKGADTPKGQLQLSARSRVFPYLAQDQPRGTKGHEAALAARP